MPGSGKNEGTAPMNVALSSSVAAAGAGYMTGFGDGFETEALPGPARP